MWPFYLLLVVIFFLFSVVMKIIWDEHRKEAGELSSQKKEDPVKPADVLERGGLHSKIVKKSTAAASMDSLFEKIQSVLRSLIKRGSSDLKEEKLLSSEEILRFTSTGAQQTGTASIRLDPEKGKPEIPIHELQEKKPSSIMTKSPQAAVSKPSDLAIDREVALSIQNDELKNELTRLQEQYDKLDNLFIEKSSSLEKILKDLEHEQKNRKEFNKVKDILEKEIKDSKAVAKKAEAERNSIKSESSSYTNRITQLEEKIKKLESELYAKDDALEKRDKKITQFEADALTKTPSADGAIEETGEGDLPSIKETAITEAPFSPEEKAGEEKSQGETTAPQEEKSETSQQVPDDRQGTVVANAEASVQPSVCDCQSKKGESLAISASQEYLSLLGEASLPESENTSSLTEESSEKESPKDLQSMEPKQPQAEADKSLQPAVPDERADEPSDEPLSDKSVRSRSFEELLLKPISAQEMKSDSSDIAEDLIPKKDDTTADPLSETAPQEAQDLPEPPPMADQEEAISEVQNEEEQLDPKKPDDLPLPIETLAESTESPFSESEVQPVAENEQQENPGSIESSEPWWRQEPEPPEIEPVEKTTGADEDEAISEQQTFDIPDDDDPDRPHLKPDILKDVLASFDSETDENPKDDKTAGEETAPEP